MSPFQSLHPICLSYWHVHTLIFTKFTASDLCFHLDPWFPGFLGSWGQLSYCFTMYCRPHSHLLASLQHPPHQNHQLWWLLTFSAATQTLLVMPILHGSTRGWFQPQLLCTDHQGKLMHITLHLAMLTGRCPRGDAKPGQVYWKEVLYLLQFFQLREHTLLPENLPPWGLAPGLDVSSVATATGDSELIILRCKSKDNAVAMSCKGMEAKRIDVSECPGTLYKP